MNRFVNPATGRLELPPDPVPTAAEKRRARWLHRIFLVLGIVGIAMSTASLAFRANPYFELMRVAYVGQLVLALVVIGIALWLIAHEKSS